MRVLYFYPWGQFYPVTCGADYVAAGHLEYFQDRGAEVHCLLPRDFGRGPTDGGPMMARYPCVKSVRLLDMRVDRFDLRNVLYAIERAAASAAYREVLQEPFDVFFTNCVTSAPLAVRLPRGVRKVVETLDLQVRMYRGLAERFGHTAAPAAVRDAEERFATARVELELYRVFDRALMISEDETALIRRLGYADAHYSPPMFPIPAGPPKADGPAEYDLAFVGSDNVLNTYGLNWFYRHVFVPYLRPKRVRLVVAGLVCNHMPYQDECVTKLGRVDDLDAVYDAAKLVVIPIFHGTGVAIKLLEALAAGRAVVSTPFGARGIDPAAGAYESADMAADPRGAAQAILDLLADDQRRKALGQRAVGLMARRYSRPAFFHAMDQAVEPAAAARRAA